MIKRTLVFLFWVLMILWSVNAGQERISTNKHDVIKVTLDWQHQVVVSAVNNGSQAKTVKELMDDMWWITAINWAFFCPNEAAYSWCEPNTSDFMRIMDWNLYATYWQDVWAWRSLIWFDYNWTPQAINRWWESWINGQRITPGLSQIRYWLNMYTLIYQWSVQRLSPMNTDSKQSRADTKQFMCFTQDKQTVYFWAVYSIAFNRLWDYLKETFNCYNAIQLDSGWSRAMIYNNQYIAWPWRRVMDAIVVVPFASLPQPTEIPVEPEKDKETLMKEYWAIYWWAESYIIYTKLDNNMKHFSRAERLKEREKYERLINAIVDKTDQPRVLWICYNLLWRFEYEIKRLKEPQGIFTHWMSQSYFNCLTDLECMHVLE